MADVMLSGVQNVILLRYSTFGKQYISIMDDHVFASCSCKQDPTFRFDMHVYFLYTCQVVLNMPYTYIKNIFRGLKICEGPKTCFVDFRVKLTQIIITRQRKHMCKTVKNMVARHNLGLGW